MIINIIKILAVTILFNWAVGMQILNLTSDTPRVKKISVLIAILCSVGMSCIIFL